MIRLIVFAVVGLVIGLGGGSGVAIMKAKKTMAAVQDSTATDSTAVADKKHGEETEGEEPAHATASKPPADSAPMVDHESPKPDSSTAVAASHAPTTPASAAPTTPTVTKAATVDSTHAVPQAPGRIAKIFAAMSAKDAARVLLQLDDADVQTVLSGLNDRQAAAILSGFPPERAAAISRAAIRGKKGSS